MEPSGDRIAEYMEEFFGLLTKYRYRRLQFGTTLPNIASYSRQDQRFWLLLLDKLLRVDSRPLGTLTPEECNKFPGMPNDIYAFLYDGTQPPITD